jgi:enoyl-CoA hydratase/carnithine racemase
MPAVKVEDHGSVTVLRLNNGVTNSIGKQLVNELRAALDEIEGRHTGLVLAGNSKFFCIGLDLPGLLKLTRNEMADFWNSFEDLVLRIYTLTVPTACAMAGHATGGGAILALACDYRFVAEGKRLFALNEVKIGVPVPFLADLMLRQIVTDRVAVEIEFRSGFLGPDEAAAVGLADAVCTEEEVEARAIERVSELGSQPAQAFALTKRHRTREIPFRFGAVRQDLNRAFMDCWFAPATQALLAEAAKKF